MSAANHIPGELLSRDERHQLRLHLDELQRRIARLTGQINALEIQRLSVQRELEADRATRRRRPKLKKAA